jgi:hypothetical protein
LYDVEKWDDLYYNFMPEEGSLDGLREIMENIIQCNLSACQYFKPGPLEYKSGKLLFLTFGRNSITIV